MSLFLLNVLMIIYWLKSPMKGLVLIMKICRIQRGQRILEKKEVGGYLL